MINLLMLCLDSQSKCRSTYWFSNQCYCTFKRCSSIFETSSTKITTIKSKTCINGSCTYLKWTLSTQTVIHTLNDTKIIVNSKYFPRRGIANEVGGMISASSRKNTVRDTNIEMLNDIYEKTDKLPEMDVYNANSEPNAEWHEDHGE